MMNTHRLTIAKIYRHPASFPDDGKRLINMKRYDLALVQIIFYENPNAVVFRHERVQIVFVEQYRITGIVIQHTPVVFKG